MEFSNRELLEKWSPILDHDALPAIQDSTRKMVVAQLLENTERELGSAGGGAPTGLLAEDAPTNNTGNVATYNPVLISLVRRAMPNLISYDIMGVQPMTGPTGLIFALRSNDTVNTTTETEAFYNEVDTDFTGTGTHTGTTGSTQDVSNTTVYETGAGMATASAEALGSTGGGAFPEMELSIDKVTVTAKSRALKAEYSTELAQDLMAIHGLNAEAELSNMLSARLLTDINREAVRTVYQIAKPGAQNDTASAGTFNLDVDANGRWSVEKYKGLMFQIEREANRIARETRVGRGNIIICSADVASALSMAGMLDNTPALQRNNGMVPDDTGPTFIGVLNGRYKVFIDPYSGGNYVVVGYKGSSSMDAGVFYCPYVPLQMVRAVGENTFQSKIGFKTRYGMVANPFAEGIVKGAGALTTNSNVYYRRFAVTNLL